MDRARHLNPDGIPLDAVRNLPLELRDADGHHDKDARLTGVKALACPDYARNRHEPRSAILEDLLDRLLGIQSSPCLRME